MAPLCLQRGDACGFLLRQGLGLPFGNAQTLRQCCDDGTAVARDQQHPDALLHEPRYGLGRAGAQPVGKGEGARRPGTDGQPGRGLCTRCGARPGRAPQPDSLPLPEPLRTETGHFQPVSHTGRRDARRFGGSGQRERQRV